MRIQGLVTITESASWLAPTTHGVSLAVPSGRVTNATGGVIVKGNGSASTVFQKVGKDTFRASIHIASPNDPERYQFLVQGATELRPQFDGTIEAFDTEGARVAVIFPAWALDAYGKTVPTHFEVEGMTLIQVINHKAGSYAYGIIADPFWSSVEKAARCLAWGAVNLGAGIGWVKKIGGVKKALKALRKVAKKGNQAWYIYVRDIGAAFLDFEGFKAACL